MREMEAEATSPEERSYVEIIKEGDKKFKYGLLWWFVYDYKAPGYGSDYKYQDWLKECSEEEIHKRLLPPVSMAMFRPKEFYRLHEVIDYVKRYRDDVPFNHRDLVDYLGDYIYCLLTHPDRVVKPKSAKTKSLMELIYNAGNRVIRNYGAWVKCPSGVDCTSFIQYYYHNFDIKPAVPCDW